MNLDKAVKRIAKKVNSGFHGYPKITLEYFGPNQNKATELVVGFISEEGATPQTERFFNDNDIRTDESIQTTLVKIIERTDAKTVSEVEGTTALN